MLDNLQVYFNYYINYIIYSAKKPQINDRYNIASTK